MILKDFENFDLEYHLLHQEMESLRDVEFSRWEIHEIGECTRWGVDEMGSSVDGEFTRSKVDEMGS